MTELGERELEHEWRGGVSSGSIFATDLEGRVYIWDVIGKTSLES